MQIKDIFKKSIDRNIQGVVTIGNETDLQQIQELDEYVCTKEIESTFRIFFKKYRASIKTPTEKMGVWVTGFFGSGKSHFLKILGYILENDVIGDKKAVDYFGEKINDSIVLADMHQSASVKNKVVLFNIDSKAKSDAKSKSQAIMDIMLRAFNESVGLCGTMPWVAELERELITESVFDKFKEEFKSVSKREWEQGRNHAVLNQVSIAKSLVAVRDMDIDSAKDYVRYSAANYAMTTELFAQIINKYIQENKTRVVFLMDEVGQFIGSNGELMLNLQTVVEDLGKYCHGQAWVVVTSQQELKDMIDSPKYKKNDFSKIQGRFDTRLLLSGSNADEVIKKRILDKKETSKTPIEAIYEQYKNKLNNVITFPAKPTWSGYSTASDFVEVYPFVSYQFELLQKVFESIREHGMSEGRHLSQNERSLLSAFQESAKKNANQDMNILVPFDSFYSTIEQFIDYDIKTVFTNAERRPSLSTFDIRLLQVLFMIKHVKEMPSTIDRLATLMVESVEEDKLALKDKISIALGNLESETLIQKNGDEYDFLTNEEQNVNRQIDNTGYSEGDVIRTISSIIFESILDNNKFRYLSRYDFPLNRFVDEDSKGSFNPNNITIKVITQFKESEFKDETSFLTETMRNNSIIINLIDGSYVDEIIKASKIETFKRNNAATMSSSIAEIMDKKVREASERRKRAEIDIRLRLKEAVLYASSSRLSIREKDAKDRILEAVEQQVKNLYFKLEYVKDHYDNNASIQTVLNRKIELFEDLEMDRNKQAYKEILENLKSDKSLHRKTTIKHIIDFCKKVPNGWRDSDIRGLIAVLFAHNKVGIKQHDRSVAINDSNFVQDLSRGSGLDKYVIYIQEKIDEAILNQVKRIMKQAFDETYKIHEEKLKEDVVEFFTRKSINLSRINIKYGPDSYPGSKIVKKLYPVFEKIAKSTNNATIFNHVIDNKNLLIDEAIILEKVESFYRDNSAQMKNYRDAKEIYDWYQRNQLLMDLSALNDIVDKIDEIINMETPFNHISELSALVFKARDIKDALHKEKVEEVTKSLNKDLKEIIQESEEALKTDIKQESKDQIEEITSNIKDKYQTWFKQIEKGENNLDTYKSASERDLREFKLLIQGMINNQDMGVEVKRSFIKIASLIPIANKKIKTKEDIENVLNKIRTKLIEELNNVDEIDLG